MDNLVISIGADTKEFLAGLTEVGEQTGSLGDKLGGLGVAAGVAFAGYTAAIMECVYAYRQEELVGQEVQATLVATGGIAGVTAGMIDELAESFSKSTTFSKLNVEQAEQVLLTYDEIGKETFPQATKAVLDLAQGTGVSAASAAATLGKALQDPMAGMTRLTRAGIVLTAQQKAQIQTMELAGNMAGAQAVIIGAVEQKYSGMAQAAAGGTGQIAVMKNAFEELAAKIGEEFAPMISAAASGVANFVQWVSKNQEVVEFTAAALGLAAAVTGVTATVIGGALAFGKIISMMEEAGIVMQALAVSARVLAGATGIGLILIAGYEIYENWNKIWPAMQAVFKAFVDNIGNAAQGLWKILNGAFHLDLDQIKAGLAQAAAAFVTGGKEIAVALTPAKEGQARDLAVMVNQEKSSQDQITAINRKAAADRHAAAAAARELTRQEHLAANEVQLLEIQNFSSTVVGLKKKELQELKNLADQNFQGDKVALAAALRQTQADYQAAYNKEVIQRDVFNKQYLARDKNFQGLSKGDQAAYLQAHEAALVGSMQDETAAREALLTKDLQLEITNHNQELQDTIKYGAAYAEINEAMHTAVYKGSETAMSNLTQLTQSQNNTLKSIGQAASVIDIEMKGAQSAMAIYAGFSELPPWIGIPLGIAGAAAAEIFAQEKAAQVMGLAKGGLIEGGIPGVDSVHTMMQAGELAVPKQNYEDVIQGEMLRRGVSGQTPAGASAAPQPVQVQVEISMTGSASQILTAKINKDKALGRYRGIS